jgi:putative tryptophan/tyrosine transport system substrate-binding protein
MRRRTFIAALGGAAAWPLVARAQQHRARRVVIVSGLAESDPREQAQLEVFRDGLRKLGWADGQDLRIETLWSAASPERAKAYVAQLVGNPPDVVVAGTLQVFLAMRRDASAIPMVFINLPDPVVMGLVANLAKPDGNFTGFTAYEFVTAAKWLEVQHHRRSRRISSSAGTKSSRSAGFRLIQTTDQG